ncbi:MAG: helix-turn-helix domain-containing protein [Rhodanobacter sp.]|nr:MAG: helix-turn-helix domain-containing protein [Rhodanobacter sp.]
MPTNDSRTADELAAELGDRLRRLRIRRGLDQRQVAAATGLSERAVRNLELGSGSSIRTLLLVLKAIHATNALDLIAPAPSVSPIELLRVKQSRIGTPRRVGRRRTLKE